LQERSMVQGAIRRNAVMAFAHDQMEKRDDEN
jgi:hypothetical protein